MSLGHSQTGDEQKNLKSKARGTSEATGMAGNSKPEHTLQAPKVTDYVAGEGLVST